MTGEYLPDSYTFDTEMVIEPIRKASVLRTLGIPIKTVLKSTEKQVVIDTIVDDPKIGIAPEPFVGVRSTNQITQATKKVPIWSAPLSYPWDELERIDSSVLPFNQRVGIVGTYLAQYEQAHAFASTTVGVRDSDSIAFVEGGTAVTTLTLASGDAAIAGLRSEIGVLTSRYGSLKNRPLILALNNVAYAVAVALVSSKTDKTFLQMAKEELELQGGPGSGFVVIAELACALTVSDDIVTITNNVNESMALFLVDANHFEIYASAIDTRSKPVNTLEGLNMNIVERWMPFMHDALSFKYILNAPIV